MTLSSARSITEAVAPPRTVFVDYPLGQTAGKPGDLADQDLILEAALTLLETQTQPGEILDLEVEWRPGEGDEWKRPLLDPDSNDERTQRRKTPQYERESDVVAAAARESCPTCIWIE